MVIKSNNPAYCAGALWKKIQVANAATVVVISPVPAILVGALVQAGAADTTLAIYDQQEAPTDESTRAPGVKVAGGGFDGYVLSLEMARGIICTVNQTDAIAWIAYVPAQG